MNKNLLLALALASCPLAAPTAAWAQDGAAPADITDSGLTNPVSGCKQPPIPDRDAVGNGDEVPVQNASRIKSPKREAPVSDYQKDFDAYRLCVVTFVNAQNALAKKHNEIANNAVNELNQYVAAASAAVNKK